MKPQKLFLLILIATFGAATANAQTADELVKKYIDAIGGKDLIGSVKSIKMESTTEVMGNEGPTTTIVVNGKGYKNISDFGGQKVIQCYTDTAGWSVNPMSGGSVEKMSDEQYRQGVSQVNIGGPLFDYEAKENKIELLGRDTIDNVNTYKIKLTGKNNTEITYFIDPSTWYVVQTIQKADMMGQEVEMIVKYSDYRKTDIGYVVPFDIEMNFGDQFSLSVKIQKAEFNVEVDPSVFAEGNENI